MEFYESAQNQLVMKPKIKRRPKKALTLAERISVINEYEKVRNTRKLAKAYGCGRTQIQNILRRKTDYLEQWTSNEDPNKIRNRQSSRLMVLNAVVHEWVERSITHGLCISDSQILQAGERASKIMNLTNEFRATDTWLKRLKRKFTLDYLEPVAGNDSLEFKKSLNLSDILIEFKNDKEKLRKHLPYYMFDALDTKSFRTNTAERERECLSDNDMTILEAGNVSYDEYQSSMGSDGVLTEVEIEDDAKNVLSFEVQLLNGKIVAKPKAHNKGLSDSTIESLQKEIEVKAVKTEATAEKESTSPSVSSYAEALKHLGAIEEFVLLKEDIRSVGIINQLEILFAERMSSTS